MTRRPIDPARDVAFDALRAVHADGAYANLALAGLLATADLDDRDAAFATELLSGTARLEGTYKAILERAAGRKLSTLDPPVVDILLLGAHQVLSMRVPPHAAVAATVDLAGRRVSERVTGLVNAVLRKVLAKDLDAWVADLTRGMGERGAVAFRGHHPRWIADAYSDLLGAAEAAEAMAANNQPPTTTLVVRPGLADVEELLAAGATPGRWSPFAAVLPSGNPGHLAAVRQARAGVQDEGSQLVALALARAEAPAGPWLDLCAGPGGKAALLAGLAAQAGDALLASELAPHRAVLVRQALAGYGRAGLPTLTITADGIRPAWRPSSFARVMADVPCTGLGALRRRAESRWRRSPTDLKSLAPLQRALLATALDSAQRGGVVAYVTCSPHRAETAEVVRDVLAGRDDAELLDAPAHLPEVPDADVGEFVQLWPHRHGTDAMFLALIRRR